MLLLIVYFLTFSIKSLYHIFYRGKIEMYHRYLFLLIFFIKGLWGFFYFAYFTPQKDAIS